MTSWNPVELIRSILAWLFWFDRQCYICSSNVDMKGLKLQQIRGYVNTGCFEVKISTVTGSLAQFILFEEGTGNAAIRTSFVTATYSQSQLMENEAETIGLSTLFHWGVESGMICYPNMVYPYVARPIVAHPVVAYCNVALAAFSRSSNKGAVSGPPFLVLLLLLFNASVFYIDWGHFTSSCLMKCWESREHADPLNVSRSIDWKKVSKKKRLGLVSDTFPASTIWCDWNTSCISSFCLFLLFWGTDRSFPC